MRSNRLPQGKLRDSEETVSAAAAVLVLGSTCCLFTSSFPFPVLAPSDVHGALLFLFK